MATHKVPQDVEAEDKLIGPLSFRQFIYALIGAGSIFLEITLYKISPFLIVIPLPVTLLASILAIPLRKDQPMEIYLLALIRFFITPRIRIWTPDGTPSLVEIDAPKQATETPVAHSLTSEAAERRLEYLSKIMDSRGWSFKHAMKPNGVSVAPHVMDEADRATDIMDERAELSKSLDKLLGQKSQQQRQDTIANMKAAAVQTSQGGRQSAASVARPENTPLQAAKTETTEQKTAGLYNLSSRPAPQASVQTSQIPGSESAPANPPLAANVSPGIIRLAHNDDLSISAIAREAHRLSDEEVVITLH